MNDDDQNYLTPRQKAFLEANPDGLLSKDAPEASSNPELKGIGGWLQFLIIALIFLGPLLTGVLAYVDLQSARDADPSITPEAWKLILISVWSFVVLYSALSIGTGLLLQKRFKRSTIPIAIGLIWLLGPIINFGVAIIADEFDGSEGRSIIFSVVWTVYLLRSKRVKNTYVAEST